ncbi:hypothetical protein ACK8QS_22500 (plasmid) [Ectopseudomonas mendocina]
MDTKQLIEKANKLPPLTLAAITGGLMCVALSIIIKPAAGIGIGIGAGIMIYRMQKKSLQAAAEAEQQGKQQP